MAQIVHFQAHALRRRGLEKIAAGVLGDRVEGPLRTFREIDQIDEGVQLPQILPEVDPVQLRKVDVQQRDVDLRFSGLCQRGQRAGEAEQLRVGQELCQRLRQSGDLPLVFEYDQNGHLSPPSEGSSSANTVRSFCRRLSSALIARGLSSPTRSILSPSEAASCRGPALRSAITSAAKRS